MNFHYINIHTHRLNRTEPGIQLVNCLAGADPPPEGWFSTGIHPWQLSKQDPEGLWAHFQPHVIDSRCLAIGETGIDRLDPAPVLLQMEWFSKHLTLALDQQLPLIIHNVRAHQDLIPVVSEAAIPVILHGYRGKPSVTDQWMKLPQVYFSIGSVVLNPGPSVTESLQQIPPDRLFTETDDSEASVISITNALSAIKGVHAEELRLMIYHNFQKVFKKYAPDT